MHMQTSLQAAFERAAAAERQLCVLIDTAHTEGAYLQFDRWGLRYESLFDGTPEACLREIAPLLVFTGELDAHARERLFAWLERSAYTAPCVCWFETGLPPSRIAHHLRRFHVVGVTEGQSLVMRWYDTRILPVWLACLSPAQANAFAADTSAWHYTDRLGDIRSLSVDAALDPLPEPAIDKPWIELNDAQYALLVDAADLTVMLARVRAVIPDETKRVQARVLVPFVAHHQSIAVERGLKDLDRQTQYVLLALYTSGQAGEQAELKAFLKTQPAAFAAFYKGLQALSDAVWEAGPPLWASIALTTPGYASLLDKQEPHGAR